MAHIENEGVTSPARFVAEIRKMPDSMLMAQDLVQQGAINVVAWLLRQGCTEQNAAAALDSLRENAKLIRDEARRRGKPSLFDRDQTGFS